MYAHTYIHTHTHTHTHRASVSIFISCKLLTVCKSEQRAVRRHPTHGNRLCEKKGNKNSIQYLYIPVQISAIPPYRQAGFFELAANCAGFICSSVPHAFWKVTMKGEREREKEREREREREREKGESLKNIPIVGKRQTNRTLQFPHEEKFYHADLPSTPITRMRFVRCRLKVMSWYVGEQGD